MLLKMDDLTPNKNEKDHKNLHPYQISLQHLGMLDGNFIHPTAVIGASVKIGKGNYIGAFCYIVGETVIGDNNYFTAFCSVGTEPEHKSYFGKENKGVVIGNNNMFREYVTVNAGCEKPTILKDNIVMLRGSYIGHDSTINYGCTISCNVLIGGHSLLGEKVNMGLGSICHQYSKIASNSMIGMGTIITKKTTINCFGVYVGNPAQYIKENDYQKQNFTAEEVNIICSEWERMEL